MSRSPEVVPAKPAAVPPGRRWLPVIALLAPLVAVVLVMAMYLQTPDPHAAPPDLPVAAISPVLPETITLARRPGPTADGVVVARGEAPFAQLAYAPDGRALLSRSDDGRLIVHALGPEAHRELAMPAGAFDELAWTGAGILTLTRGTSVHGFTADGAPLAIDLPIDPATFAVIPHTGELVAATADRIALVNLATRTARPLVAVTLGEVRALAVDHRHRWALVERDGAPARLVDLVSGRTILSLPVATAASLALVAGDDGRPTVIAADRRAQVFAITDAKVEPLLAFRDAPTSPTRLVAASGRRRVAIVHAGELVVYDLDRRAELLRHVSEAPPTAAAWNPAADAIAVAIGAELRTFALP